MSNTSVGVFAALAGAPIFANAAWITRHNVPALQRIGGVPYFLTTFAAGAALSYGIFYKDWKIPTDVCDKIAAQEKAESVAAAANFAATRAALVKQVREENFVSSSSSSN